MLGIPASELTPKVQEAIARLMAEVDSMRLELDESRQRIEYLEQLADQDTLAPVANRRAFVRELTRNLSYSERYGTPSSVIYPDLNGLKRLNDTKGHAAGDAAILKVPNLLAANVFDGADGLLREDVDKADVGPTQKGITTFCVTLAIEIVHCAEHVFDFSVVVEEKGHFQCQ